MSSRASPRRALGRLLIPRDTAESLTEIAEEAVTGIAEWYCGLDHSKTITSDIAQATSERLGVPLRTLAPAVSLLNAVLMEMHRDRLSDDDLRAECKAAELSDEAIARVTRLVDSCRAKAKEVSDGARVRQYASSGPATEAIPEQVRRFVDLVSDLPAVRHVAYAQDGDAHRIWSITDAYDMEAYDDIFERELALYDEWPGTECDFFVLALEGRPVQSALPDGFEVVWSRAG